MRPVAWVAAAGDLALAGFFALRGTRAAAPEVVVTPSGARMVLIPGGEFEMGDGAGDAAPRHRVRVQSFLMDVHEVTQRAYRALAGENPARWKADDNPVEQVRWGEAARHCNARSIEEGLRPVYDPETLEPDFSADGYRLPTEAEWEYACRAGGRSADCFDGPRTALAQHAWFDQNAGGRPHPVSQRAPNALGLYDMLGNVWEWCHDRYAPDAYAQGPAADPRGPDAGDKRVLRGGSFASKAEVVRATHRFCDAPGDNDACFTADAYGFRCVRPKR